MATITGFTAERMQAIEDASVVDGDVIGGNLILTKHDGTQINAGSVIGPEGPQGPVGSDLDVISATPVRDVGIVNQIRAGRQLTPTDFANIGLSAPIGLWNLSNLTDSSGNGRNLVNKGTVPFDVGINGAATTAAKFSGSTSQSLYISDTGAADPFRLKAGTLGCWIRVPKVASVTQQLISKRAAGAIAYDLYVDSAGHVCFYVTLDGSTVGAYCAGMDVEVCDLRWHFIVASFDGAVQKLYIDGMLESVAAKTGYAYQSAGPFNIGSGNADGSTAATEPCFGRIDEAFITNDVLSEDQVRNLYCAKISHALGSAPARVMLNISRRRRGAALVSGDFPSQPLRLYNFSAGVLTDEGSQNRTLTNNGSSIVVAGADGAAGNAFSFNGAQSLSAVDTSLPTAAPWSYGFWFKTTVFSGSSPAIGGWGTSFMYVYNGLLIGRNGTNGTDDIATNLMVNDGEWHFAVITGDSAASATEGKRKFYLDGRLVAIHALVPAVTLGSGFRVGAAPDNTLPWIGQVDTAFICNVVLTPEQIYALYAKASQTLAKSPKNPGDHIEAMSSTDLLAVFDTLSSIDQVELKVA